MSNDSCLYDRCRWRTQLRAVLFHGLADHSRLAILGELERGERRVAISSQ